MQLNNRNNAGASRHLLRLLSCNSPNLLRVDGQSRIELIIFPLLGDQVIVRSPLDNAALLENHDAVRIPYRRETVGDHK